MRKSTLRAWSQIPVVSSSISVTNYVQGFFSFKDCLANIPVFGREQQWWWRIYEYMNLLYASWDLRSGKNLELQHSCSMVFSIKKPVIYQKLFLQVAIFRQCYHYSFFLQLIKIIICSANQWTVFHMITASVMKELTNKQLTKKQKYFYPIHS